VRRAVATGQLPGLRGDREGQPHARAARARLPAPAAGGPLATEPSDVAVVQPDFAPDSFAHGVVQRGAALVAREGDFGFSAENGDPARATTSSS